jgi:hypothetical protein
MADPAFRKEQEDGLRLPHIAPLNGLVDELRDPEGRGWVPYVAPLYGGVNAEMLNLFRDPGPKTNTSLGGSGFICVENDDAAAERLAMLLDEAGIPFERTVPWNAYPWYINRKPRAAEIDAGVEPLCHLLSLLPRLRVVMLNGGEAKSAWRKLQRRHGHELPKYDGVIPTYHTGNQAFIGSVEVRATRMAHLRQAFSEAALILRS